MVDFSLAIGWYLTDSTDTWFPYELASTNVLPLGDSFQAKKRRRGPDGTYLDGADSSGIVGDVHWTRRYAHLTTKSCQEIVRTHVETWEVPLEEEARSGPARELAIEFVPGRASRGEGRGDASVFPEREADQNVLTAGRDGLANEKIELTTNLVAAEDEVKTLASEKVDMVAKGAESEVNMAELETQNRTLSSRVSECTAKLAGPRGEKQNAERNLARLNVAVGEEEDRCVAVRLHSDSLSGMDDQLSIQLKSAKGDAGRGESALQDLGAIRRDDWNAGSLS